MVRAFLPQSFRGSIPTNTNFPPQEGGGGSGREPTFADVTYVSGGERGSTAYRFGGQQGKEDYEDLI